MARRDNAPSKRKTSRQLTANQKEWQHQISNLKRRIKDLEDLGAIVTFQIPDMPKRVRKAAIEKIKKIGRKQLLKDASQVNPETGELEPFVPPERGKTQERREEVRREREQEQAPEPPPIWMIELQKLRDFVATYAGGRYTDIQEYSRNILLDRIDEVMNAPSQYAISVAKEASEYAVAHQLAESAMDASTQEKADIQLHGFSVVLFRRAYTLDELKELENNYEYNGNFA